MFTRNSADTTSDKHLNITDKEVRQLAAHTELLKKHGQRTNEAFRNIFQIICHPL